MKIKLKTLERWWVDLLWVMKAHQGPALHSGPFCTEGAALGARGARLEERGSFQVRRGLIFFVKTFSFHHARDQ